MPDTYISGSILFIALILRQQVYKIYKELVQKFREDGFEKEIKFMHGIVGTVESDRFVLPFRERKHAQL